MSSDPQGQPGEQGAPAPQEQGQQQGGDRDRQRPRLLCRFFVRGQCTKGAQCTYSHDPNAPEPPPHRNNGSGQWNHRGTFDGNRRGSGGGQGRNVFGGMVPCKFFMRSSCHNGDHCRYSHDPTVIAEHQSRLSQGPSPGTLPANFYPGGMPPMGGPMPMPMGYQGPYPGAPMPFNPIHARIMAVVYRHFTCDGLYQSPVFQEALAGLGKEDTTPEQQHELWAKCAGGPHTMFYSSPFGQRLEEVFSFMTPDDLVKRHVSVPDYQAPGAIERMLEAGDVSVFWSLAIVFAYTGTTGVQAWDAYFQPPQMPPPGHHEQQQQHIPQQMHQ